jgi:hypothetical protein
MEAAWEIPLPGVKLLTPTAIHAHCLLLYFQAVRTGRLYVRLHPAAFFNCSFDRLLCACGSQPARFPSKSNGKIGSNARQNGICNGKCGAAPFRRAHEISPEYTPTNTGHDRLRERACPDIGAHDVHCFSRALLVALLCTACSSRRLESVVRVLSATVEILSSEYFRASCRMSSAYELIGSCRMQRAVRQGVSTPRQAGFPRAAAAPTAGSEHRRHCRRYCLPPR